MTCHKCGFPVTETDLFCQTCGAEIIKPAVQAPVQTPVQPTQPRFMDAGVQPSVRPTEAVTPVMTQTQPTVATPVAPRPVQPTMQPVQPVPTVQPTMQPEQPVPTPQPLPTVQPTMQPVQPVPTVQPTMQPVQPTWSNNEPMNQPSYNQNQPKSKNNIIIIALVMVVVIMGVLLGYSLLKDKKTENNVVKEATYKISFNDFAFEIPESLRYEQNDGVLTISNEDGTWAAQLEVTEGSYNQILQNKIKMESILKQGGYTANKFEEKKIANMDYLVIEISKSGTNALVAFSKLNSMNVAAATIATEENDFSYKVLETITPILKSAIFEPVTNNMDINIDLEIEEIIKSAE